LKILSNSSSRKSRTLHDRTHARRPNGIANTEAEIMRESITGRDHLVITSKRRVARSRGTSEAGLPARTTEVRKVAVPTKARKPKGSRRI